MPCAFFSQQLLFLTDNVFQAEDCDAFDSDVDEAPTAQTMFMANLSSADLVTDEAGPSYDSDILSEVQDHDHYQDVVCAHHEEHAMHDNVQLNHDVDSHADHTSDSNMIPYDQYVKDNAMPVVHSNVSSVPNDAFMMIYNDMYEPYAQSVSNTSGNTVVENSLTAELATYKEQVELYERRAKFELTEREQKINEKLRLVISDRNFKEETLKKELHSIKFQLASTINHNKSMVEEVTFLKKDFKQKENKYLEDFLDMKSLKEKKQLTPEQIFWSQDLTKLKSEALKEQTTVFRPIKALTVYPPNTPATLVPRVLPTKSQVKIHIFTLIQLFLEFDKTCKKRITPTGLTEGERGFEQTKECYLIEVISFFKTLKDNFEGIQKALTKEIKDVFEELEAEVAQNVVDRKHDAVERKNLLIANDNLIGECLSKEVFYVATNSELNVARFTEMHVANTIVEARCLELEAELANLRDKSHHDNQEELINCFSKLEHYKELYDSIKITRTKHIEQVTALTTENVNLKAQTQIPEKVNSVSKDHVKPKVIARGKYAIDVEPIVPRLRNNREAHLDYLRHLKESVETIRDIVPIGKRNCYLDVEKSQSNPIYKIVVDIMKHTNFFRAFTSSSTIPSIYIQQFWDTVDMTSQLGATGVSWMSSEHSQRLLICASRERHMGLKGQGLPCYKFFGASSLEPILIMLKGSGKNSPNPSIHSLKTKRNLAQHTHGKKKATLIVIPSIRFTKLIIYHHQRKHKFRPRPDSPLHLPNEEPVLGYLKFSAKGTKREVFGMPIPGSLITTDIQGASYYQEYLAKVAKHERLSIKKRKSVISLRSVDESMAEDVPEKEPRVDDKEADVQRALEESLKSMYDVPRGQLPPVVIREPESGKYQPLPEVPRKGKEKVIEEQVAHSDEESKEDVLRVDAGGQGEGQAGPDPDPGNPEASQPMPSPMVHPGSDREHVDLDVTDVSSQPPPEFGDLFFNDKPLEANNDKATVETKAESMVSVTIQQDTSSILPMKTPIIDLTSRPEAIDKVVMDAVDWTMQALLWNRFRDLPEADMKEILHQRMWETDSYKTHKDHMQLYEALEKLMNRDHSEELAKDLARARPSGASGSPGASGSSQVPPQPHPPPSTNQEDLQMDDDMALDEQAQLYDDEDIRNAYIPKVNLRQDWHNVSKPLPLCGPPGQVTIQSDFFFNKDLEYLRYGSKGSRPALSISKMKAAYYPDVGLEQIVPDQMWIEEEHTSEGDRRAVRTHIRILSVVSIEVFSMYGYDYMKKIVLRRMDLNEHVIAERDFKAVMFRDRYGVQMIMHFNEIYKFSDGMLQHVDEALDYRVKEFKINRMNPGLNISVMDPVTHKFNPLATQVDIEKVAVCSSLRSLKPKRTIESRAKRSSKIISLGHYSIMLSSSHTVKSKTDIKSPTHYPCVGFNSLVHSLRAFSTLRRSGLRTASTAAKPCQGESLEFYLITGSIYTDQQGTVVLATLFNESLESKVMRECCFVVERDAWLRGEFTRNSLDVLQGFSFFLQMGLTLILATLDGLDVDLLGDVIGEDDCDDDG
uniref:Retrovirus-related Pol polyprotein from transposon TNT 1-94 n=1 Tax=Tanacetum cinerariifolium TaxID=118510 RepID=A0A6L2KY58_TANCI|nr:retrovirus-related Pol polyprotein from transposon TNT 1-94 [Tanacetum cinerariifolium]